MVVQQESQLNSTNIWDVHIKFNCILIVWEDELAKQIKGNKIDCDIIHVNDQVC